MHFTARDVFLEDAFQQASAAVVIGAPDPVDLQQRISAAVALFKARRAPLLLLFGGRSANPEQPSEVARMREAALRSGIPDAALIPAELTADLPEFAKHTQRLLKSEPRLQTARSLALVSSAWHLLRVSIVFKKFLPRQVTLYCHPTPDGITARNWMLEPRGKATAENELRLIEKLVKSGYSLK
ncbi:MAG: YdcF family protein [Planctomycetota bacterium]